MKRARVFPVSKANVVAAWGPAAVDDDACEDQADDEKDFDY